MTSKKQKQLWFVLAALSATMWGISGLFAKALFNLSPQITPMWLTQIRLLISGAVLLVIAKSVQQQPFGILKNRHDTLVVLAYGLFGLLPVQLFYFIVVQEANASIATILQFIGPFFVMAYLAFTHQQVMRRLDIIAALVAFGGVFLLSTHGRFDHLAVSASALFWGLLTAVGEATYTLIPRQIVKRRSSLVVTGWGMIASGLGLVLIHPVWPSLPANPQVLLDVLAVIVIGTIIPFQLMANALRYIKPAIASLLDAFEPLSATIGSVWVFDLAMTPPDWLGSFLVVIAVLALSLTPKKRPRSLHK